MFDLVYLDYLWWLLQLSRVVVVVVVVLSGRNSDSERHFQEALPAERRHRLARRKKRVQPGHSHFRKGGACYANLQGLE